MSEADTLKMAAEMVDKFSTPMRELRKLLQGAQKDSETHTRVQRTQNEQLGRAVSENIRQLREGLAPALNSVGLSTVSLGGAIAAVTAGTVGFGTGVRALDLLGKQAGLTVNYLRQLEGVAAKFQIAPENIEAGAVAFDTTMQQMRRNVGETVNWFRTQEPNVQMFGEALKKVSDNGTALQMVFRELNTLGKEADRRTFLGGLGLPQEWAKLYGEDLPAAMRKWQETHAEMTAETIANAAKFNDAWEGMKQSIVNLRDTFGPSLLTPMTDFFNAAVTQENSFVRDSTKAAAEFRAAWRGDSGDILPSLGRAILGDKDSDEHRLFDAIRGLGKGTGPLPGQRPTASEAPLNRGRDDDDALPSTSRPRSFGGDDDTKRSIKEGSQEGVRTALEDFFRAGSGGGGAAFGVGGGIGNPSGRAPGGMIGARPGFGGFRPRGLGAVGVGGGPGAATGGGGVHDPFTKGAPGDAMAPAGTGTGAAGSTTEISSPSGRKFRVSSEFAPNFQGFLNDYERAGGIAGPNSGGLSTRPGNASYHPLGRAIDLNQTGRNIRGGGRNLPVDQENALATKWGLRSGNTFHRPDTGHFEVARRAAAQAALAQRGGTGGAATSALGSWYSQHHGKFSWHDPGDRPGSNALGVPDSQQGIALPSRRTLGQYFDVTAPNGQSYREQQTDVGPAAKTGRGIDISAAAAERMGYSPHSFPTDARFSYRRAGSLLGAAKDAGFGPSKIEGGAKIQVDFSNMPKGVRTGATAQGVFDQVQVNRGEAMKKASE